MSHFIRVLRSVPWAQKRLSLSALVVGFILLLSYQTNRLDLLAYDYIMNTFTPTSTDHTVVIEIDDKSIAYLGQWPWSRDTHAQLLSALEPYSPKAIGFDILFSSNRYSNPQQDKVFAKAIQQANNVVLPVTPRRDNLKGVSELLPQADLASNVRKLGHVDFEIDIDGIIRHTYLYAGYKRSTWPVFALALTQVAYPNKFNDNGEITAGDNWTRRDPVYINFSLPHQGNRIKHLSYIDVLNNQVNPEDLQGKIVLIGMNATAMGDQFATPITTDHQTMSGVEINAHLVNSLINNQTINQTSSEQFNLITTVLVIFCLFVFTFNNATRLVPTLLLLVACTLSVSAFLLIHYFIWYPPVFLIGLQILMYAGFSIVKTDVMRNQISSLQHSLFNDNVTQLPNEKALDKYLTKQLSASNNSPLQLMNVKVSNVNGVTDLLGNQANNVLLNKIKTRMQKTLPAKAFLAKGSDASFYIGINYLLTSEQIKHICEQLINELSKPYEVQKEHFRFPVHIGVCNYPSDGAEVESLKAASITALHRAMENKNSTTCFYSKDIKQGLQARAKLESDLSKAVKNQQIEVYYQPQVSSSDGSIIGAEALARWRHPDKGLINPDDFIPIAESSGLILEIGQWVMKQACLQAKRWQLNGHPHFRIAVNLSPKQFNHEGLFDDVIDALSLAKLEPHYLELELTESSVVEEFGQALSTMEKLKHLGVTLSIDDFGTGYSSLSYLKNFPMDRLKIDRSFIAEITNNKESQDITKAIISMAHSLNMGVIAEGIESVEQHSFLNDNQVEELQGYYFGKPTTVADMDKMLSQLTKKMTLTT